MFPGIPNERTPLERRLTMVSGEGTIVPNTTSGLCVEVYHPTLYHFNFGWETNNTLSMAVDFLMTHKTETLTTDHPMFEQLKSLIIPAMGVHSDYGKAEDTCTRNLPVEQLTTGFRLIGTTDGIGYLKHMKELVLANNGAPLFGGADMGTDMILSTLDDALNILEGSPPGVEHYETSRFERATSLTCAFAFGFLKSTIDGATVRLCVMTDD